MTRFLHSLAALLLLLYYTNPTKSSSSPPSYPLTRAQIREFRRNGVLIIPNLIQNPTLLEAQTAAKRSLTQRSLSERLFSLVFKSYQKIGFQTWRQHRPLEDVAFDSPAPDICAQLMGLQTKKEPLRLLKDALLVFGPGNTGCGWHVDDKTFWPCEDYKLGYRKSGINVWITLSPVRVSEGGGLAVAPGSHRVRWREKCRSIIAGSDGDGEGVPMTCNLEELSPEYHEKMENMKKVYDLEPGDAIFHDRYIFHRADHFVDAEEGDKSKNKFRYSIRYMPASAKFHKATFGKPDTAASAKGLDTGDPISKAEEYFPQVWPCSLPEERSRKPEQDTTFNIGLPTFIRFMKMKVTAQKKEENKSY